jgi:hypothetical protein
MTLRKRNILFVVTGIILIMLGIYYYIFQSNMIIKKSIEYNGCKAQYQYSLNNFAKENAKNGGHGRHNEFNLFDANQEVAHCLCEKYSNNREKKSEEFILKHYNSENFMKDHYIWSVLSLKGQIDSLCKYKREIFIERDTVLIPLCHEYELTHDISLKNKILDYYHDRAKGLFAASNYYKILLKLDEIHPIPMPPIDTICKYRDELFSFSMYMYND